MLVEQTLEKLNGMKLHRMASYLRDWLARPGERDVGPADLVGLLADAEWMHRENKKLSSRLSAARLRQAAALEDIDYGHARGLAKTQVMELSTSKWAADKQNVLLTGPTGVGKSFLACALGQKACRDGYSVVYRRASRLFDELAQARADETLRTYSSAWPRPRCSRIARTPSAPSRTPALAACLHTSCRRTRRRRTSC